MDEGEDSTDVRENDPALAGWYTYRARVRNMADLVCITYGLRNPDWLQDRLLVMLSEVREAREGRFLGMTGETANFVTLRDEQIVDERKKAAVRLRDLLIDDRAGFGFTPETHLAHVTVLLDGDDAGRKAVVAVAHNLSRHWWTFTALLPEGTQPDTAAEHDLLAALRRKRRPLV